MTNFVKTRIKLPIKLMVGVSILAVTSPVRAQSEDESRSADQIPVIIVTAQKREQSINTVGMSIGALSSDALTSRGISDIGDLGKVVPGFTYAQTPFSTPVYTLRGVGVYESGFASSPAVAVYVDEIALPYPYFQRGATLDLERVEVLKGPQGTLFGQNSTGGAINYIAAKPTDYFAVGGSVTAERFGHTIMNGYISGPLGDTVKARLAGSYRQGGAWQRSVSRPGDELGDEDFFQARLLVDWQPSDDFSLQLNINGFHDGSDTQAPQLKAIKPQTLDASLAPAAGAYEALTGSPIPTFFFLNPYAPDTAPDYIPTPLPDNLRDADWPTDWGGLKRDNNFFHISARADYALSSDVELTAISSYQHMNIDNFLAFSGTDRPILDVETEGFIEAFSQELRVAGSNESVDWVIGANYDYAKANDNTIDRIAGLELSLLPLDRVYHLNNLVSNVHQKIDTYSVFGNIEYHLDPHLTVQAGLRYSDSKRVGQNCAYEPIGTNPLGTTNEFGQAFSVLSAVLRDAFGLPSMPVSIQQGDCYNLTPDTFLPGVFDNRLHEDNVSWRLGLNYQLDSGALVYANASRGFKSGVISGPSASSNRQYEPATQERLDAYELGVKAPLLDHKVQLNAAVFYYDYRDKQVRTRIHDLVFQQLELMRNVPKSRVKGAEFSIEARPTAGMTASVDMSYLDTRVTAPFFAVGQKVDFTAEENLEATGDPTDPTRNYEGSRLPFTPKFNLTADAEYAWPAFGEKNQAFAGASVAYHSATNGTFSTPEFAAPSFTIPAYTTLDFRVGVRSTDGWSAMLFARNVTNEYSVNSIFDNNDERFVYTNRPATYGITISIDVD